MNSCLRGLKASPTDVVVKPRHDVSQKLNNLVQREIAYFCDSLHLLIFVLLNILINIKACCSSVKSANMKDNSALNVSHFTIGIELETVKVKCQVRTSLYNKYTNKHLFQSFVSFQRELCQAIRRRTVCASP